MGSSSSKRVRLISLDQTYGLLTMLTGWANATGFPPFKDPIVPGFDPISEYLMLATMLREALNIVLSQ